MKNNKTNLILTGIMVLSLLLIGCSSPDTVVKKGNSKFATPGEQIDAPSQDATPAEQQECTADTDCVPIPTCHPRACINKEFEGKYRKPEMCTMMFDCSAAYTPDDCQCVNKRCTNMNLGDKGCQEMAEGK